MATNLTHQEAMNLVGLPKKILDASGNPQSHMIWTATSGSKIEYELAPNTPDIFRFRLHIQQSGKNLKKISLHLVENNQQTIPILRLDFCGQHGNPEIVTADVPDFLKPFAGKWFTFQEHHMHYHVQGYKDLAWAIPISEEDFPIKEIGDHASIVQAIQAFLDKIGVQTIVDFQGQLF